MRRWAGIAGILFVALAIGSSVVRGDVPSTDAKDAMEQFARFYGDGDNHSKALASAVLGVIGQFFFLWFLGGLWSTLRTAAGATSTPTIVLALGGAGFFTLGTMEHLVGNVVGITLNFSDGYVLDPGLALILSDLATGVFLAAMVAAGAAAVAAGLVIRRTKVLPGWLLWLGVAIAALALPVIPPLAFIAAVLLAVWVVVISAVMIQRNEPEPA